MQNILLIKGSPRANSSSNLLADKCLEGILSNINSSRKNTYQINEIYPHKIHVAPCSNCQYCYQAGACIINDDMQDIIEVIDEADIILVSAPVFFNGVPAQLKKLVDRCQVIWAGKYKSEKSLIDNGKKRLGFLFSTAGAANYQDQFTGVQLEIGMFFRVVNTEFRDRLMIDNVDDQSVKERPEILDTAFQIGSNIRI